MRRDDNGKSVKLQAPRNILLGFSVPNVRWISGIFCCSCTVGEIESKALLGLFICRVLIIGIKLAAPLTPTRMNILEDG